MAFHNLGKRNIHTSTLKKQANRKERNEPGEQDGRRKRKISVVGAVEVRSTNQGRTDRVATDHLRRSREGESSKRERVKGREDEVR